MSTVPIKNYKSIYIKQNNFIVNGYNSEIIDKIINKKRQNPLNTDKAKEKYKAIEYGEQLITFYLILYTYLKDHKVQSLNLILNILHKFNRIQNHLTTWNLQSQ